MPALRVDRLTVTEAPPSPPPGPIRDALAESAARRVERAEQDMMAAADRYTDRLTGVVLARLRSPRARRGTRYWTDRVKSAIPAGDSVGPPTTTHLQGVEVKALDGEYIVPDNLVAESVETLRPVALQVAADAAVDSARRIRRDADAADGGMFAVDQELLGDLIDEALEDLLGTAERYAAELRGTILDGDRAELPLDELLTNVEEAAQRGGNWLRLNARTVGTALAGKAALEQARALGVTHAQWLSRRDERVRPTHVRADGQVRQLGETFRVGVHELEYPGDPSGLPGTASEVMGCRCSLVWADVEDEFFAALADIHDAAQDDDPAAADALLDAASVATVFGPSPDVAGLPNLAALTPAPQDVVAWRQLDAVLDVVPGQQVRLPAGTALGLVAPSELTTTTLALFIPAGTMVGVSGGALVLAETATMQVLAAGAGGVQGRLAG